MSCLCHRYPYIVFYNLSTVPSLLLRLVTVANQWSLYNWEIQKANITLGLMELCIIETPSITEIYMVSWSAVLVSVLLANMTLEELDHPAEQDSCLYDILDQGLLFDWGNTTLLVSEWTNAVGDSTPDLILVCKAKLGHERLSFSTLEHHYTSMLSHIAVVYFNRAPVRKEPTGWGRTSNVRCWWRQSMV